MMPRGVRPTPPELRNMVPRGGPTHPPGIAERWHQNLHVPSLAKERNPGVCRCVGAVGGGRRGTCDTRQVLLLAINCLGASHPASSGPVRGPLYVL